MMKRVKEKRRKKRRSRRRGGVNLGGHRHWSWIPSHQLLKASSAHTHTHTHTFPCMQTHTLKRLCLAFPVSPPLLLPLYRGNRKEVGVCSSGHQVCLITHTHTHLDRQTHSGGDLDKERRQIAGVFFTFIFPRKGIQQQVSGGTFQTESPVKTARRTVVLNPPLSSLFSLFS